MLSYIFCLCQVREKCLPKECHGRPAHQRPIGNVILLAQVLGRLDGRGHPLHREERGQVRRVRGNNDQSKEPPDSSNNAGRSGLWI